MFEATQIRGNSSDLLIRRNQILAMGQDRMDTQKEIESIFPELGRKLHTKEHGTECVANGLVRPLGRTVLGRGTSGGLQNVAMLEEKGLNLRVFPGFPAEVKTDYATGRFMRGNARAQDVQPCDGDSLSAHGDTEDDLRLEVVNNAVGVVPVDAEQTLGARCVLRSLKHEAHIDCKALTDGGGNNTRSMTTHCLAKFRDEAIGSILNILRMFERWEALGNLGEEDQTRWIGVKFTDVPHHATDGIRNMKDRVDRNATVSSIIGDCLME
jgi:hypothetical protein